MIENNETKTREQWLNAAVESFRPYFLGHGLTVPPLRISCGFPSKGATSPTKRRIGECWDGLTAADGKPQLFISPFLDEVATEGGVLATVVHEIIHATIGCEAGHGPKFVKTMKRVGLAGKATATVAGPDLLPLIERVGGELGAYPHVKLSLKLERKKQTTRMRKCECLACGYTVRLTQKWIDIGFPICPAVGHGPMNPDLPKGEDDFDETETETE